MSTIKRIAKNTSLLFGSEIISRIMGFFYITLTARYLGVQKYGIFAFALAYTGMFGIFIDLGLRLLATREISRRHEIASKFIGNTIAIKFLLSIPVFILAAGALYLLGYSGETVSAVFIVMGYVICNSFTQTFYSLFQAFESMEYQSFSQVLTNSLMLLCIIGGTFLGWSVTGFAFIYLTVSVIMLGFNTFICIKKFVIPKIEFDLSYTKLIMGEALSFGLGVIFIAVFYQIDSVMLSLMKGDSAVGLYNAPYKMIVSLLFIPGTLITALYPFMSRLHNNSDEALLKSHKISIKYLSILAMPIGVATTILAEKFILIAFGPGFAGSVPVLRILIWSSVLIFISMPSGNLFNSVNKQSIVTRINGICVLFNIVANFLLIPQFGIIGAASTTVFTELISFLLLFRATGKAGYFSPDRLFAAQMCKTAAASIVMGVFIYYFINLNLLLLIPAAVLIFAAASLGLKVITREDIELADKMIS